LSKGQQAIRIKSSSNNNQFTGNIVSNHTTYGIYSTDSNTNTFTNNTITGCTTFGGLHSGAASTATLSGNTYHSNGIGFSNNSVTTDATFTNYSMWRNNASGLRYDGAMFDCTFNNLTLFGNNTNNILLNLAANISDTTFNNLVSNGDTTFSTTNGFNLGTAGAGLSNVSFINCDFSTVSGIKTAHTNDFNIGVASAIAIKLRNTKLAASTEVTGQSSISTSSYIGSSKHDQTTGSHKMIRNNGTITIDTVIYDTTPSMRITPTSSTEKILLYD